MSPVQEIWNQTLCNLDGRVAPHLVELWLKPLTPVSLEDERLVVCCPNRFTRDWVREHFLSTLQHSMPAREGVPYQLELTFDETSRPAVRPVREPSRVGGPRDGASAVPRPATSAHPLPPGSRNLTFERFVVGPSNRLAAAAAHSVVADRTPRYNPLFLNSACGLGKTHLACAIVNDYLKTRNGARVAFAPAERFLTDMVHAIGQGRVESFKDRYRRGVDLLVVDDVQFLAGKKRTQSEFFHALDELFADGKQVVLTGNGNPASIPDLAEPLRSRLTAGLVVEIDSPDEATRIAIAERRALEHGVRLPDGVAPLIASVATVSVRDLEGAVNRVLALASLSGEPVTLVLAEEALRPYLRREPAMLTPERILAGVARAWGIEPARLKARSRRRDVLVPRQVVLYFCRKYTPASLQTIGDLVERNHSSVIHALTALEKRLLVDPHLKQKVDFVEQRLLTEPTAEEPKRRR